MHSESKLISLLVPVKAGETEIELALHRLDSFLATHSPGPYEIIFIVNGHGAEAYVEPLRLHYLNQPQIRILALAEPGKGRALKHGFQASAGQWIFLTDIDLPYDLSFFIQAIQKLQLGYEFVTGNRRSPDSTFTLPTKLLPLVYKRHRLGIYFNRIIARTCLGLTSDDTQAGIKAMSRRFADAAFSRQKSQGFLADLEFHLVCVQNHFRHVELPIHFHLRDEKSTVQLSKQFFETLFLIPRLTLGRWNGFYRLQPRHSMSRLSLWNRILRFAWGQHANLVFFLVLRWILTPYSAMEKRLPRAGKVLDLGCGHGLMTTLVALLDRNRQVEGWDHDTKRISIADKLRGGLGNLTFKQAGVLDPIQESFRAVIMVDVLHYFREDEQLQALGHAWNALEPGGVLLFREINPAAGMKSQWNRIYEKIATFSGFTKSENESQVHLRTPEAWQKLAEGLGFKVFYEKCSSFLFADILFIGHKPRTESQTPLPWRMTADDWGMSPGINRGILALAQAGIIRRISAMADGPALQDNLAALKAVDGVEIGLHFSLSNTPALKSPGDFLKWHFNPFQSNTKKFALIEMEFERQWHKLQASGIDPAYLDSHHHTHVFPKVATCLARHAVARKHFKTIRIPLDNNVWQPRKFILGLLALSARAKYEKHGWNIKPFYYPMGSDLWNPLHLADRLSHLPADTEVIFHPSEVNDLAEAGSDDGYREARVQEFQSLSRLSAALTYRREMDESARGLAHRTPALVRHPQLDLHQQ
ncbi:MAG TPA: ChbG/HpnK family deacetylase [Oligoflexus sp.]|uniref:ChbG/HpnK family deacetylase n=1 Tax=Oligoflexus sp. TaxID=1971216 RepID=UPI002D3D0009|nr:ChbG/HpnK family deacetylase [Oligoflexus sp.]HYX31745.1 ChbG/HpnK family deacetylase [Oligoflexus sp.]